ncbi:hypothetical protein F443_08251 [Phytophthora nicotianae P1569]|uniref:Uncharacterized protein n=1 Tax=Phytophthora nicotianae P1569 TaxID=1317065 RepID=V9FAZ9_PHYNI|nr:hypothetical protein F443_08251 [Phytophthora nicotianae P1569]
MPEQARRGCGERVQRAPNMHHELNFMPKDLELKVSSRAMSVTISCRGTRFFDSQAEAP